MDGCVTELNFLFGVTLSIDLLVTGKDWEPCTVGVSLSASYLIAYCGIFTEFSDTSVNQATFNHLNSSVGVKLLHVLYTCVIREAIREIFVLSSIYECTHEHLQLQQAYYQEDGM